MKFILQSNLYSEEGWDALVSALTRLGVPYSVHKVVPFVGDLDPEPEIAQEGVIVMGSYSLARQAIRRRWKPGAFLDNLDFETQRTHWGENMLNFDATVCRFDDVPEQRFPFFLRPVHDTKCFTGTVLDYPEFEKWRDGLRRLPETADPVNDPLAAQLLTADTPVMVCRKKEIYSETRTWIVAGKVVTASGYKMGTLKRYVKPGDVDTRITDFAQLMANAWSPNDAYVMDVADTPEGLRIVEVNNLNSAGFYLGDMVLLVEALVTLVQETLRKVAFNRTRRDWASVVAARLTDLELSAFTNSLAGDPSDEFHHWINRLNRLRSPRDYESAEAEG